MQKFTTGAKNYRWNKNLPIAADSISTLTLATSHLPETIPLKVSPKSVWRDRFRFAQSGAERRFLA